MASSRAGSSVIEFDEQQGEKSELQFQDFGHGDAATLETSDYSSSFPGSPILESENAGLLEEEKKPLSFWEFGYYQSFFDVDTEQVVQRIMWSMLPVKNRATYLDRVIRPSPDLYGPFWISTTLIFSTAISANIAEYFMTEGQDKRIWHYDFRKVSLAATAIYSYVFLLPLALWGLMWYRKSSTRYTLLEILCVYGYSLFIYIPISILWLIQVPWLQWTLVVIGAALSGLVLAHTFWPTVRDGNKKIAALALVLILLFHTLLAVGFVAVFFQPPRSTKVHPGLSTVAETTTNSSSKDHLQKMSSRDISGKGSVTVDTKLHNSSAENQPIKRKANSSTVSGIVNGNSTVGKLEVSVASKDASPKPPVKSEHSNSDAKKLDKITVVGSNSLSKLNNSPPNALKE